MENRDVLDQVNRETYARADVIKCYQNLDMLLEPERILLERLTPALRGKKLLDIAIGGGRTTKYLLQISKDYTGIDYTPEFVEVVRTKYKEATILCCDARDMKPFADESFDFALFSFNGIDSIPHEGRIEALREVYRVLKKGGVFMFSSHNRDHKSFNKLAWQEKPRLSPGYLKYCLYCLYYLPKHLRMKKHEIHTDEFAVINDNAHGFSLLVYYISIPEQVRQLEGVGFKGVEAYDMEGKLVAHDTEFPWVHYLARK